MYILYMLQPYRSYNLILSLFLYVYIYIYIYTHMYIIILCLSQTLRNPESLVRRLAVKGSGRLRAQGFKSIHIYIYIYINIYVYPASSARGFKRQSSRFETVVALDPKHTGSISRGGTCMIDVSS